MGNLETDLYIKETDARSYLNFSSAHPNHIYSGIVYSQCLRLRRIINCNIRLSERLKELKGCFLEAGYPTTMVDNITNKVNKMERNLYPQESTQIEKPISAEPSIRVITTFGSDSDIIKSIKRHEDRLSKTRSFSESPGTASDTEIEQESKPNMFKFVKRTGANLKNKLVKVKNLALGNKYGCSKPCRKRNCKCCKVISDRESYTVNGKLVKCAPGSCSSYNVIYLVVCKLCNKCYVGRSVRHLNIRIGEHRRAYYELLVGEEPDPDDDDYAMGIHLMQDHGLCDKIDFENSFNVALIDLCSPKNIEKKEHLYIHLLNTIRPMGLNSQNPFAIPLLNP